MNHLITPGIWETNKATCHELLRTGKVKREEAQLMADEGDPLWREVLTEA